MQDPASLSPEESAQFLFWMTGSLRIYQHQHLMYLEGNLSAQSWSSTENLLKGFVQTIGFQAYWNARKNTYSTTFQTFVDSIDTTGIASTNEVMYSIQNGRRGGA